MKPHVLAAIMARGGSKGVPRKNIRHLAGKPLIAYAIEAARSSSLIDRVIVSTDDAEIAEVARKHGAEVPFMRPHELARDDAPEWAAWQHAIRALLTAEQGQRFDVFVSLPPTSPMRAVQDIDATVHMLLDTDADIVVTVKYAERNPYFNMVRLDATATAQLMMAPPGRIVRRQDAPAAYDMTTVAYATRPKFVLRSSGIFDGKVKAVVVPAERALDIDTEFDFQLAELLLSQRT